MNEVLSKPLDGMSSAARQAWGRSLVALAGAWVLVLVLFWDTASNMVAIWYRSETFNHCFLVLPISLWLVWRQRAQLAAMTPHPSPWVLVAIAGAVFAWLLGDLVAVNSVTQLAVVTLLVLSVPALLGIHVAWAIAFPLGFLYFGVPIGEFLLPQLMESTADFTVMALRWSGIPVLREGLLFVIPSGNWSVVEACSGVRYLIASMTVGTLFAYLNYRSTKRRLLFVLVSMLVPIVANWLRAYMIVMLGHLSSNRLAVGVDHLVYGWVFFGVVILLMFFIGARWSEPETSVPFSASVPLAGADASFQRLLATVVAFALLVLAPVAANWSMSRDLVQGSPALSVPVALANGWVAVEAGAASSFEPVYRNPSAKVNQLYRGDDGSIVGLYLAYYRNQDYRRKLVSSDNALLHSGDLEWARLRGGVAKVLLGAMPVTVRSMELRRFNTQSVNTRLFAWQLYWVDGSLTANDYLAKMYGAAQRLRGRGDESAAIVFYTEAASEAQAQATLSTFVESNYPAIDAALASARGLR